MNFAEAIVSGFQNYANFSGRASRSEYWYWTLFAFLVGIVASILDNIVFHGMYVHSPISSLSSLALLLPGIAVSVRRLHDINRTGWWLLIAFTIIGILLLLYWDCVRGTAGRNRFGDDPLVR